jgi:hypothetical protein
MALRTKPAKIVSGLGGCSWPSSRHIGETGKAKAADPAGQRRQEACRLDHGQAGCRAQAGAGHFAHGERPPRRAVIVAERVRGAPGSFADLLTIGEFAYGSRYETLTRPTMATAADLSRRQRDIDPPGILSVAEKEVAQSIYIEFTVQPVPLRTRLRGHRVETARIAIQSRPPTTGSTSKTRPHPPLNERPRRAGKEQCALATLRRRNMTTYTFTTTGSTQFVDWSNPSAWIGGVVPNSADADVVFPTVTILSTGDVYHSFVSVTSPVTVNSISLTNNYLLTYSTLSVANAVAINHGGEIDMYGGSLSAGSVQNNGNDIQGDGQVHVSGTLTNNSSIIGSGLTLTVANLVNAGTLQAASGDLTVNVAAGGFADLSGTTLTGGTYAAGYAGNTSANSNTLYLNVGGLIVSDAATIALYGGGAIDSFDNNSGNYVPLQSSLTSVAPSGTLSLATQTYNWGHLTVDGALVLSGNATLNASQLTVGAAGQISGNGVIDAPIANDGIVIANAVSSGSSPTPDQNYLLDIGGAVTGTGTLEVGPGFSGDVLQSSYSVTLKLSAPVSENVVFSNSIGTLQLDNPTTFTGSISPGASGDQIILSGVSLASVTGYSYSGDTAGGTLTLQESGTAISIKFLGNFGTESFTLSAGPQLLSTSPPSLAISVGGTSGVTESLLNYTGSLATGEITNDPTINGFDDPNAWHGAAGATVHFVIDGTPIATTVTADASGAWTFTPTGLSDGAHTVVATETYVGLHTTVVNLGTASLTFTLESDLLNALSLDQQTELIYIGYFDRAADGSGFSFWEAQDAHAQTPSSSGGFGQSAAVALTNIANSFTPQPETIALYPFLSNSNPNYNDPTVQVGLTTFVGNVYENLFDRAADSGGLAYWTGQIESGAVGLGAAVLAIANGAQAADETILLNKISVALDFTTQTAAANVPVTPTLVAEAKAVLAGVDGVSVNDASVAAAEALIAPWIASHPQGMAVALVGSAAPPVHPELA